MIEQKTNSKKHCFFKILLLLILIQPIEIFGAEPIAKGKWKGDASVAHIKISFGVLNQASMDSIVISYQTYSHTYTATLSTGLIQSYGIFSTSATGEGITVYLSGRFLEDGISVSGTVSIFLENSGIAGISWSGSFQEPFSPPYLMSDFLPDKTRGMKP